MVSVAVLTARTAASAATLTTAGVCPQPEVRAALQVAALDNGDLVAGIAVGHVHGVGGSVDDRRIRERARRLGLSAASVCHLAWAQVLARVSGRTDVVFGTVLFGRMEAGQNAERVMGLFINTLPVRVNINEEGAEASVRQVHAQLGNLLQHEHASLALAQRCSAVAAPTPLFSALLNYRHSAATPTARAESGIQLLSSQERTNYPCNRTDIG